MIEFDVDMGYLLECDELDKVVLNDENGEHGPMEFAPIAATADKRSCASCPEMDNSDSYISHIHRALEWHDEHVPRPTNPIGTCVVLQGKKPPEEVLFVRDEGGVTHYLPEETCHFKVVINQDPSSRGRGNICECDKCGYRCARGFIEDERFKHCPNCGKRIEVTE